VQLHHEFTIPVTVEQAWPLLLDLERIVPCLPGAAVDSLVDDVFTGRVAVKLGAIGLTYRGEGKFIEREASTRRIVVEARGSEQRGGGTAAATITATLAPASAGGTRVTVVTDLDVTGKPAQFGRGLMSEVGGKLIDSFATKLGEELKASPTAAGSTRPIASADPEPIDVLKLGGGSVAKQVLPFAAAALIIAAAVVEYLRRRH